MYPRLKSILDISATVLVIIAASVLLWRMYRPASPSRAAVDKISGLKIEASKAKNVRGQGTIALIEFSDFECPFCAHYAQETARRIDETFVEPGQVRHVVFNFPLPIHEHARKASEAAECAALQGRYWDMYTKLFGNPKALTAADLSDRAKELRLDPTAFDDCLANGVTASKIQQDIDEGHRLGVDSTPLFFLGLVQPDGTIALSRRINGAQSFEQFDKAIRELLPVKRARL